MVPVSGSPFKLVFTDWYEINNDILPCPNGNHSLITEWIKKTITSKNLKPDSKDFLRYNEIDSQFFYNNPRFGFYFRHSNFYYHATQQYSSNICVPIDKVIDNDKVYFYPVEIECNTANFLIDDHQLEINGNLVNYSFADNLPAAVVKLVKENKLKILFVNMVDPSIKIEKIEAIRHTFNQIGIADSSLVFLQGNVNTEYFHKYKDTGIQMFGGTISLYQTANDLEHYPIMTALGYESDYVRNVITEKRPYKFLSFNRFSNKPHRMGLLYTLIKHKLLDQGLFSFLYIEDYNVEDMILNVLDKADDVTGISDEIRQIVPYELDTAHLTAEEKISFYSVTNNKLSFYQDSYIHIVTETEFDNFSTPFFSEKTWRPILNLQPFIYLGNHSSLNKLHELGFKTFHPYIDESYDCEPDIKKRFSMIQNEILKLSKMSLDQIHSLYHSIVEILLHNQIHLKTFKNYNPILEINNIKV